VPRRRRKQFSFWRIAVPSTSYSGPTPEDDGKEQIIPRLGLNLDVYAPMISIRTAPAISWTVIDISDRADRRNRTCQSHTV
jgi:hypothetical protein